MQLFAAEQVIDNIQNYSICVITNVINVTHLIKTILKQSNTSFKLPKKEWNHLIIHIIQKILKTCLKTLTNVILVCKLILTILQIKNY